MVSSMSIHHGGDESAGQSISRYSQEEEEAAVDWGSGVTIFLRPLSSS